MRRLLWLVTASATIVIVPGAARAQAQAQTPLSEILVKLIQTDIILAPPPPDQRSHVTHFIPGEQERIAPYYFNQAIISQLTTFPLGSSSGGFAYTYDPDVRSFTRGSEMFGPAFADRALTLGRGKWSFGANYQHSSYSTFEGKDISNGSINFYLTHVPVGFFVQGDVIQTSLHLSLKTDTFVTFVNYGVTNRLDVGAAIPLLHVAMNANVDAKILRFATAGITPPIHVFPNGTDSSTFPASGSASGIGDILLRGKYRFLDVSGGGLGAQVDLRLPTGDDTNLLGSGATQARVMLLASGATGRFAPHVNVGYTVTGSSKSQFAQPVDEVNYTFGSEFRGTPRLTINADFVGRTLRGQGHLVETPRTFSYVIGSDTGPAGSTTLPEFALTPGNTNLLDAGLGIKYNPVSNLLISANVLFPINRAGIRATVTPVIGFDYTF